MLVLALPVRLGAGEVSARQAPSPPIEIEADKGLEWQRKQQVVIARGNARAVRGNLEVHANRLAARYRQRPDGRNEFYRLDADGSVRITTPSQTATGEHATYDLMANHLLMTGSPARLVSDGAEISADRSLEYWPDDRRLVARGNAVATQTDKQLRGDTITAYLQTGPDGRTQIETAEAVDNVTVITPDEVIRADRGTYNAHTGIATVSGSVKITREADQLEGCRGEIDLNSGVSKLFACEKTSPSQGRVRGRIQLEGGTNN